MSAPQHIRVFISSPTDVTDERNLARRLLKEELSYDPFLRDKVTFDVVSWDDPAAPIPMLSTLTPQEAVNRFGCRPSECDVVIVVLWSRLGTHLDLTKFKRPNGEPYLSGTEYEYEDAANAQKTPDILVYRCSSKFMVDADDSQLAAKTAQRRQVLTFFHRFMNSDGSYRGGCTEYATPTDFVSRLEKDLKTILQRRLEAVPSPAVAVDFPPTWTGSPYPGLRPFDVREAPVFFGREHETDALVAMLRDPDQGFVVLVGASGSGKSSLVRAGLLPRLMGGAIDGNRHWCVLYFRPGDTGDNPFLALAVELSRAWPPAHAQRPADVAEALRDAPQLLMEYVTTLLADHPINAVLVLFVDQLEELFTIVTNQYRVAFGELLANGVKHSRVRVLATLRSDFLAQSMAEPTLAPLLQASTFQLGPPGPAALADIIRKPAKRAGLILEEELAEEILRDTGGDSGALPLVAFCLEELYRQTGPERRLNVNLYRAIGGLRGAISRCTGELLNEISKAEGTDIGPALSVIFRSLVHVDASGKAARQRAAQASLIAEPSPIPNLVEMLIKGRLLLAENAGGRATVTLTHEALLQEWPALRDWLESNRALMRRVQRHLLLLTAPETRDRRHAVEELREIGPAATEAAPALIEAVSDADMDVRRGAVEALGNIGPAAADGVAALSAALGDADRDIRQAAFTALGKIGPAALGAVPALIAAFGAFGDPDPDLQQAAITALDRIGPTALASSLAHPKPNVRWAAADVLAKIGPAAAEAVPALAVALGDAGAPVRWAAAKALRNIGPQGAGAVPALATALHDADLEVRKAATEALVKIGPTAAGVVPALAAALRDPYGLAAQALAEIGPAGAEAVPALSAALGDAELYVRWAAVRVLVTIGPAGAEAVPALSAALGDADSDVRRVVAKSLGNIGPAAAEAVPALIAAFDDADRDVRLAVADALRNIGPPVSGVVPALAASLAHPKPNVRWAAAGALAKIGPAAAEAVPALAVALGDAVVSVRRAAAKALRNIGPAGAGAVPALAAALYDTDSEVRQAAADVLRTIGQLEPGTVQP